MSANALVLVEQHGGVLALTLNRPEVLNSLTDPLLAELLGGLEAADKNADVGCVVITGAGRAFCAGQDLRFSDGGGDRPDVAAHLRDFYVPVIDAITNTDKPVIAAVNGVAAGAGLSLALACDLRVAAASATFIQAFVRIGLVPDAGGSYFLPRVVGAAKAMEMSLLGDPLDATAALACGLVSRVHEDDEFSAATMELATRLSRGPRSTGLIKRLLRASLDRDLPQQLEAEEIAQTTAAASNDFVEGVSAFLAKRPASFTRN